MTELSMSRSPAKSRTRTCVGCQKADHPERLVRFVLAPDGSLTPDLAGGAFGRGAWVHASAECLRRAVPRGFARAFRSEVGTAPEQAARALRVAANRRVIALLGSALAARKLVVGATAVASELRAGTVALCVIATDAQAAAGSREVEAAVAAGRAAAWGTKSELGLATRRTQTGIAGVLDKGLARAIARSIELGNVRVGPAAASKPRPFGEDSTEE